MPHSRSPPPMILVISLGIILSALSVINSESHNVRLSLGSVNARSGRLVYFDFEIFIAIPSGEVSCLASLRYQTRKLCTPVPARGARRAAPEAGA